jgi:hypothetical protein
VEANEGPGNANEGVQDRTLHPDWPFFIGVQNSTTIGVRPTRFQSLFYGGGRLSSLLLPSSTDASTTEVGREGVCHFRTHALQQ